MEMIKIERRRNKKKIKAQGFNIAGRAKPEDKMNKEQK